ncbi:MAG: class I SAM-dependent methyltransferase [Spirochaetales bacterium]|nr:class I SAM-dependent methyltransferase [Spirochaetales bacterium]
MNNISLEKIGEDYCDFFDYFHPGGKDLSFWIADNAGINGNMKILDVGCGMGTTVCLYYQKYNCSITGIDINPAMISRSKKRASEKGIGDKVHFKTGNALNLEFEDNSFDFVLNEGAITLSGNPHKAIEEMKRVVKPGHSIAFVDELVRHDINEKKKAYYARYLGIDTLRTEKQWLQIIKECNVEVKTTNSLWGIDSVYKMRLENKRKGLYSFGEKMKLFTSILSGEGLKGIFDVVKIETIFIKAYRERTLGTFAVIAG